MPSTSHLIRLTKIVSVICLGLLGAIVSFGNITDYYSNFHFVEHVMKMDTIFPASNLHYRGIHSVLVYHLVYIVIIAAECLMTFCCLKGGLDMTRNLKSGTEQFHGSKKWSVAGVLLGLLVWFFCFEIIGGEWFAMWQSPIWNGLVAAERLVTFLMLTLILLHLKSD